jgi:hypothetical protein
VADQKAKNDMYIPLRFLVGTLPFAIAPLSKEFPINPMNGI